MANGAGGRSRPTRRMWRIYNGPRSNWPVWVILALCLVALALSIVLKVNAGNFSATLRGFVTGVSICDTDEGGDCLTSVLSIEVTDGDESTIIMLPSSLLPDKLKEGDPVKIEISIDEARRIEANERMEIRKAKQEKSAK